MLADVLAQCPAGATESTHEHALHEKGAAIGDGIGRLIICMVDFLAIAVEYTRYEYGFTVLTVIGYRTVCVDEFQQAHIAGTKGQ